MVSIHQKYPEYSTTSRLDELRSIEYGYLDKEDHTYLDYTGSGLAADSQRRAHQDRLASTLCGNPHSLNPTSEATSFLIEQARAKVLSYLNASSEEYAVIFTANATAAAKLVGESYPFSPRSRLVLTTDNHNSVNGIREFARRHHASVKYVPVVPPQLRVDQTVLVSALRRRHCWESSGRRGLFAYPAQSNFSGVKHPLAWVALAQAHGYDILLDVAAYLPTAQLDLSLVKPDFMILSWYKVFGYPTGVGCLIARRDALSRLTRPWFSGGTIKAVAVAVPWHEMASDESAFEDGTLNFLAIPDITFGLDWIQKIGMDVIERRVRLLTRWFLDRLKLLQHTDGSPMTLIYGPTDYQDRGGAVTFNFLDARGRVVDERLVAAESSAMKISLRTGCFCNPGVAENALGLTIARLRPLRRVKNGTLDEIISTIGLPSAGAIRVSFGLVSTVADLDRFFAFAIKTYQDRITTKEGLPPREKC